MADPNPTEILLRVAVDATQIQQLQKSLAAAMNTVAGTTKESEKLATALRTATATEGIEKFTSEMLDLQKATAGAGKDAASLLGGFKTAVFRAVGEAAKQAGEALVTFFRDTTIAGVKFNATLETASVGIASVLKTYDPSRYASFNDALARSADVIDQLKQKALESPATFEQLLQAYQSSAGAMTAAGIPLQKQVDLITNISQAMAALGINTQETAQEARALLTGTIDGNSRLAASLLISPDDLTRAKEQGRLFEFLTDRLKGFGDAGEIAGRSISALESNLKEARTQVAADATKDLAQAYKELLVALTDLVKSDGFKETMQMLSKLATGAVAGTKAMVDIIKGDTGASSPEGLRKRAEGLASRYRTASSEDDFKKLAGDAAALDVEIRAMEKKQKAQVRSANSAYQDAVAMGSADNFIAGIPPTEKVDTLSTTIARAITIAVMQGAGARQTKEAVNFESERGKRAAADKVRLENAKKITDELLKHSNEYQKEIEAARYSAAMGEHKLDLLRDQEGAATKQRQIDLDASYVAHDFAATYAAILKHNVEIGRIERERAKVQREIDADKKREQDAIESAARKAAQDRMEVQRFRTDNAKNELESRQLAIADQIAVLDTDDSRTSREKFADRKKLLAELTDAAREYLKVLREIRGDATDPAAITQAEANARGAQKDVARATRTEGQIGPNPNSIWQTMDAGMTKLMEQSRTVGQVIVDTIGSAFHSVTSSLTGLIMGTQTWAQALWNIGNTVLTTIVNGLVEILVQELVMDKIRTMIHTKRQAEDKSESAGKATNAGFTAISQLGPIYGLIAFGAAIAGIMALARGFADGGYTGRGGRYQPAGVVHAGEVVFSQSDVARFGGVAAVENLRVRGGFSADGAGVVASPAAGGNGGPVVGSGQQPVNIAYFNTRQDAETWLVSQRGTRVLKDWMRDNRYDT